MLRCSKFGSSLTTITSGKGQYSYSFKHKDVGVNFYSCQCFTGPQISSVVAFPDDGSFNKALDYFKNIQHDSTPKGRQCFGIKTSTYVQLSGAMSAVETFSGDDDLVTGKTGETKEFTYYPGTINELKLSIQFKGSDPNPRTIWKVGNAEDLFHDIISEQYVPL